MSKKFSYIIIFAMMITMLMATPVLATPASKIVTLKPGETANQSEDYKFFKINVPEDGYITIKYNDYNGDGYGYVGLYTKADTDSYYSGNFTDASASKKTVKNALNAGTYYLRCSDAAWSDRAGDRFSYTYTKADNGSNYCAGKAKSLAADKTVTIAQTKKSNYDRWYKITLSSKKSISITSNSSGVASEIYDANMDPIGYSSQSSNSDYTSYTYKYSKLPKGTYYIRIPEFYYSNYNKAALYTLKWK